MEVEGIIIQVLPTEKSKPEAAKAWTKVDFIVETEGQYPKKVCINSFNDKIPPSQLAIGNKVKVDVNLESREYNGKWYTTVSAWKMEVISSNGNTPQAQPYTQPTNSQPFAATTADPNGDLPF